MLSGMTNNPKVKKCLITGTHLPHGTAQLRGEDGGGRGQEKKHTPQQRSLMELTLGKEPML